MQFSFKRGTILLFLSFFCFAGVTGQNCAWLKGSNNSGNAYNIGGSTCTDTSGNVYVTGTYNGTGIIFGSYSLTNTGYYNPFLVKYSPNGTVLWARNGQGFYGKAFSVTTDRFGNVFACGFYTTAIGFGNYNFTNAGDIDYYIVKYDPNGNVLWARSAGAEGTENLYSVSCDSQGNVYTVGYSTSSVVTIGSYTFTNNQNRMLVIKYYGSSGNVAWAKSGTGDAAAYAVHVDKNDNVYITGEFYSPSLSLDTQSLTMIDNDPDFFVFRLDTSGNTLWGRSGSNQYGYSLTSNQYGDVFVSGNYNTATLTIDTYTFNNPGGGGGGYSSFLVKYNEDGNIAWAKNFGSTAGSYLYSGAADISSIYIVGFFHPFAPIVFGTYTLSAALNWTEPMYFVRLDFAGNVVSAKGYPTGGGTYPADIQAWLCTDKFKNVYIFSNFDFTPFTIDNYTLTQTGSSNVFLAKFHFGDVGIKENVKDHQQTKLFPNPNSGAFTIKIAEAQESEKVEITIFDITGRLLWTEKRAGGTEFQLKNDLRNGMYLVKVKFEDGTYDIHHLIISK